MCRRIFWFGIALVIALVISGVGLKGYGKSAQAAEAATSTPPVAPEGYVVVEEDVLTVFVDAPGESFHKARESFLKKDFKTSAAEIRKSAAFLKLQAARAAGEGKKGLMASIDELEKLAKDVESGTVTSATMLDQAFAQAHHALAQHHYLKAIEYKAKGDSVMFGHALKAAVIHLEHGFAWAGQKLESATVALIKDVGLVSGKLIEGTGWISKEIGKIIEDVGAEIMKLGKIVEPKKQ